MLHALQTGSQRSLRCLERLLLRVFAFACRFPRTTLLCLGAWMLACLLAIPRLSTVVSVSDLLDDGFESLAEFQTLQNDFSLGESAMVLFQRTDSAPLQISDLCAAEAAIRQGIATSPDVKSVRSPFDARRAMLFETRLLFPPYVNISCSPSNHLGPLERSLVEAGKKAPAENGFPGGPLSPLFKSVYGKAFVDPGGTRLLAHVEFEDAQGRAGMGRFDPNHVRNLQKQLDAISGSTLKITVSGLAKHQEQLLSGIEDDRGLNLAAAVLLILLVRIFTGRFLTGLLLVGTLLGAGVLVFGTMAMAGGSVDMLTNGLFILLAVATLQDFLFVADDLKRRRPEAWQGSFRKFITPCFFTSLTTVVGFGSLVVTEPVIIRTFGAYAALGVACEWLILFLGVPSLLTLFPRLRQWNKIPMPLAPVLQQSRARVLWNISELIGRLSNVVPSARFVFAAVAIVPFAAAGLFFLKGGDSPLETFPKDHPHGRTMTEIRDHFGFETEVSLVFPVVHNERGKAVEGPAERAMDALRAHPGVGALLSPWDVQDSFTAGLPPGHTALVLRNLRKEDTYQNLFVVDPEAQKSETRLEGDTSLQKARALVLLADSSSESVEALQAIVQKECPQRECTLVGEAIAFADFTRKITEALIESLFVGLTLATGVLAYIALAVKQPHSMSLLITSLWGPIVTVGLLPLLPIRINFVTCVFAAVVVGISGDNAIQYWFASRYRARSLDAGVRARADASLQMTLCMVLASLLLCFSSFVPPRMLGILMALSFLLMTVGDLFLTRGLLAWSQGRTALTALPKTTQDR